MRTRMVFLDRRHRYRRASDRSKKRRIGNDVGRLMARNELDRTVVRENTFPGSETGLPRRFRQPVRSAFLAGQKNRIGESVHGARRNEEPHPVRIQIPESTLRRRLHRHQCDAGILRHAIGLHRQGQPHRHVRPAGTHHRRHLGFRPSRFHRGDMPSDGEPSDRLGTAGTRQQACERMVRGQGRKGLAEADAFRCRRSGRGLRLFVR